MKFRRLDPLVLICWAAAIATLAAAAMLVAIALRMLRVL